MVSRWALAGVLQVLCIGADGKLLQGGERLGRLHLGHLPLQVAQVRPVVPFQVSGIG
jgi:hypothetical protein